ncbi:MAG: DUF4258 domain-containing protein [Stellaceae bacterium]
MAGKPIVLSKHAQDMVDERKIDLRWIEYVLRSPTLEEPDPHHPGAVRAYAPIAAFGGRMLRVVSYDSGTVIRVIALFFDRRATARSRMP